MSSHVLSLFRRKKKKVNLSNEEKVSLLSEKAVGLFEHMRKAYTELGQINEELLQVIDDEKALIEQEHERHQRVMEKLQRNISKAHEEIQMNTAVQNELSRFIR